MTPGDRDRIAEMLLQDPPASCRAVSRATGYSDWTIRKIARELDGDPRPMKQRRSQAQESTEEVSALTSWLVFGGIVAGFALVIWAGVRWAPRLESQDFPPNFHIDSFAERSNDETQFPQ
jgi:hypothetical protein